MINEIAKLFRNYMEISGGQKSEKEKVQLPVLEQFPWIVILICQSWFWRDYCFLFKDEIGS